MGKPGGERPFSQALREARLAAGMTQEDLAARSGLTARTISDLERQRTRRPYFRSVGLLADALGAPESVRAELHEAAHRARRNHDQVPSLAPPSDIAPLGPPEQHERPLCQLPPVVADFTGREDAGARVRQILARAHDASVMPVAMISGAPGVGKTSLALRGGHSLRSLFPDGQLYLQLAGASCRPRDPGEALGELLRALGVHGSAIPDATSERAALYRSRLADRRVLLVADDAASAAQVRPLLPGTPGSAVVVTSRTRLAGLPGATMLELDPFSPSEAVGLLTRIVGGQRVEAEQEAARALVAACGMIPLAVRIAGAKLAARPSWPLALLYQKMAGERRRLDELEVEDLSVRASFALSYQGLHEEAKRLFRLVGLLGPRDFAEWVFAALLGAADAGAVVNELVDKSLLTPTGIDATGQARYRLHDLLREYALERLADEPAQEQDSALQRALDGWLQLAELADQALPSDPYFPAPARDRHPPVVPPGLAKKLTADPIAWFTAERLNLLSATEHACANGWHQHAAQIALHDSSFNHLQDRSDDSLRMWRQVKHVAERTGDTIATADAQLRYAAALIQVGQAADAIDLLDRCVQEFERSADRPSLAFALYWRGICAYDLGHINAEMNDAERGVALSRQLGNRQAELLNLRNLGICLASLDRYEEGVSICERALSVATAIGDPSYKLAAMDALAYACNLAGQYDRAANLCLQRLDLSRQLAAVRAEGLALGMLGDSYHGLGHYREAVQVLSAALPIFRNHASRRHHALCLLKLGYAHREMGQHHRAAGHLEDSLLMFRELRLSHYEERALAALAECRELSESAVGRPVRPGGGRPSAAGLAA